MWNIFIALMSLTLAFAFFDPNFFVAYLISIAVFGLYQAIFMANAGGAWDNAKKLVEVDFKEKNTPVHAATVVGDTVGDPFKDTTRWRLNPDHQVLDAVRAAGGGDRPSDPGKGARSTTA
jgi:K(+)-stimulated pyrophosphate-energized sodium pump